MDVSLIGRWVMVLNSMRSFCLEDMIEVAVVEDEVVMVGSKKKWYAVKQMAKLIPYNNNEGWYISVMCLHTAVQGFIAVQALQSNQKHLQDN